MPENKDIERRKPDDIERQKNSLVQRSIEDLKKFEEQGLANIEELDLDRWDLHRASWGIRPDFASALIARGDDVNASDETGWRPLHEAAPNKSLNAAHLVIEHRAEVNVKNRNGITI